MTGETSSRSGQQLGHYLLHEEVGRGGMGVVYRATHSATGDEVAVKLMLPEIGASHRYRERFVAEVQTMPELEHPHVVPVYDAGEIDGELFIAMRYIRGSDLKKLIEGAGPLDPARVLPLVQQVAAALDHAHGLGVVHRDVKPQNILVSSENSSREQAFVTDFGLVKPVGSESTSTRSGEVFGSIQYISPEQVEGLPTDGRADVYSLACVTFEALTGRIPFDRPNEVAVLWAHVHESPPRVTDIRPQLAGGLDVVVANAMAKHPDDRYLTCGEFVEALEEGVNRNKRAVVMPMVRPLVRRKSRAKTERDVWAPNFFPELSRVRKLSHKTDWPRLVGATSLAISVMAGVLQLGHPQGVAGAFEDVAGAAGSLAEVVTGGEEPPSSARRDEPEEVRAVADGRRFEPGASAGRGEPRSEARGPLDPGTPVQPPAAGPSVVPVGQIVFSNNGDLYKTEADGSGVTRLTQGDGGFDRLPAWSPDGKKIAFVLSTPIEPGDPDWQNEIWTIRSDGSKARRIADIGEGWCDDLSWSPDGRRLLYDLNGIHIVDLDGSNKTFLGPGSFPDWSPDGSKIAFTHRTGEIDSGGLWLMDPDGSNRRQITEPTEASGGTWDQEAAWSPDGSKIAFSRGNFIVFSGQHEASYFAIYVVNADGSGLRRVTGASGEYEPSFSPTGQHIVYSGSDSETAIGPLWVIGLDGSGKRKLVTGDNENPDWSWPKNP